MRTSDTIANEILSAAGPAARLRLALELTDLARELALAGLRKRFPGATEADLRLRLLEQASRAAPPPRATA